jgi:hypothetical protein
MNLPSTSRTSLISIAFTIGLMACTSDEPSPADRGTSEVALQSTASPEGAQTCGAAQEWVESNKDHLPTRYENVITHSMLYRRHIFSALTPAEKSQFWVDHLNRYRSTHSGLSAEQTRVLDDIQAAVATPSVFEKNSTFTTEQHFRDLEAAALKAFGKDETRALTATLGPAEDQGAVSRAGLTPNVSQAACTCSVASDWCVSAFTCRHRLNNCIPSSVGCGTFGLRSCDGLCKLK